MDKHTHMSDLKIRIKLTTLVAAGILYDERRKDVPPPIWRIYR